MGVIKQPTNKKKIDALEAKAARDYGYISHLMKRLTIELPKEQYLPALHAIRNFADSLANPVQLRPGQTTPE